MGLTALSDIAADALGKHLGGDSLELKGGKARTVFEFGLSELGRRWSERGLSNENISAAALNASEQFSAGWKACERMVLAGLLTSDWKAENGVEVFPAVCVRGDPVRAAREFVIVPQFAFIQVRLDFAITVLTPAGLRIWAVECDGQEFHQDAVSHASRDAFLGSWGVGVLHLSGAEIYRDVHAALSPLVHEINSWRCQDA